jgi:inosine-uridine nucleoside N-ribohydrolase
MPQFRGGKPAAGAFYDSGFNTIDDLLTIAVLYGLQGKNECRVAVVSMSRPNLAVANFGDAVMAYFHGPAGNFSQLPPIGMRTEGAAGETPAAFTAPFERKKPDGSAVYRAHVTRVLDTGDPVTLIRNYLEAQQDGNAFFVLGGPATNFAAALDFPGVKPLIAKKAKLLVWAGGAFPEGAAEDRIKADLPAARKVLAEWPTPIVACGAEVAKTVQFPGAEFDKQFPEGSPDSPVIDAYRAGGQMPYDTPAWSMTAALYAARTGADLFRTSPAGSIAVDAQGRTSFTANEAGKHRYLIVDAGQKEKIAAALVQLAATKPAPRRFRGPQ